MKVIFFIYLVVPRNPLLFFDIGKFEKTLNNMYEYIESKIGKNKILSMSSSMILGEKKNNYKMPLKKIDLIENTISNNMIVKKQTKIIHNDIIEINNSKEKNGGVEFKPKEVENIDANSFTESNYVSDAIINTHPRYGNLAMNIRKRRGKKVNAKIPIYKDIKTNLTEVTEDEPYPGFIHMDAMTFGTGCCCLQFTIGSCSLNSACYLYDQLIPFTPILLALTSSSPIFKGKLSAYDNRFDVLCQSVDDRTEDELDPNSDKYINKSRYSPAYSYISENIYIQDFHNDYPKYPINKKYYHYLIENGIAPRLAEHFCNIFMRDPLVLFDQKINNLDENDYSHFENFNSTNWNSLRFKPPKPEEGDSCYKIEVRPCDLQFTPFENSAIIMLALCLYRSILYFDTNFIIPISKVDKNFERAYKNDSINTQKYFWRINGLTDNSVDYESSKFLHPNHEVSKSNLVKEEDDMYIKELTIKEIFCGSEEYNYPGLLKHLQNTVLKQECFHEFYGHIVNNYLSFLEKRAKGIFFYYFFIGDLITDAQYIRKFVTNHQKYNNDSIVSDVKLIFYIFRKLFMI